MKLNHLLLRVSDLVEMTTFLVDVIGLEDGFRPPFPFAGNWLYSEGMPLIHLTETKSTEEQTAYLGNDDVTGFEGSGAVDHFALQGADYSSLIERLSRHQVSYFERSVPLTGEHQVFILAPNHLKIEMLFADNRQTIE